MAEIPIEVDVLVEKATTLSKGKPDFDAQNLCLLAAAVLHVGRLNDLREEFLEAAQDAFDDWLGWRGGLNRPSRENDADDQR